MFSIDLEEEKKEKEKKRQKKIDELLKKYDEVQNKQAEEKTKANKVGDNFLTKNYTSNSHVNKLIKCMIPVALGIGVGCVFWGGGFLVNEISKAAPALSGLSLNTSITNLIATATFWKVIGLIAAVCFLAYLVWECFDAITTPSKAKSQGLDCIQSRSLQQGLYKDKQILQEQNNYINNTVNKPISYQENINKNSYNIPQQTNNNFLNYNQEQKNVNMFNDINKNRRNVYEIMTQNSGNFEKDKMAYQNQEISDILLKQQVNQQNYSQ